MASRTYVPQLRIVTAILKRYCNKYQVKLQENLSEEIYALLLVLLDAADALLIALGETPIIP